MQLDVGVGQPYQVLLLVVVSVMLILICVFLLVVKTMLISVLVFFSLVLMPLLRNDLDDLMEDDSHPLSSR